MVKVSKNNPIASEFKSLPDLIEAANETSQYLGEDSVCYMYMAMLDYLKLLDGVYHINIHTKIATKKE